LIIDPAILVYATFIGGSGNDRGNAIAVDSEGNAYIAGDTTSTEISFPATTGPDLMHNGATDAFVAKVNAAGTSLSYAGFIGGSGIDQGNAIAVDNLNRVYFAGSTLSQGVSFPGGTGFGALTSFDSLENGGIDGFVAKVNAAGTALIYAGYVGGVGTDRASGIAVDSDGVAYMVGETSSDQASFPSGMRFGALPSSDNSHNGAIDGFVVGVNPAGTALIQASYIGGIADDRAKAIAVDDVGDIYITGETDENFVSFPIGGAGSSPFFVGNSQNGGVDAFAMKICVSICNDLRVAQVDSPDPVRAGDNVRYTITVTNSGPDLATQMLTDQLPATVTLVSATPSSGSCSGVKTIICALGKLANGAGATVVIVAATTVKGTLNNLVTVDADETETRVSDNRDVEQTVATFANLTVQSLVAPAAVLPGATISIGDTTQNLGTVDATSPTVTRFYLSSDSRKDTGDIILGSRTIPALAKKQSSSASTSVMIP